MNASVYFLEWRNTEDGSWSEWSELAGHSYLSCEKAREHAAWFKIAYPKWRVRIVMRQVVEEIG